MEHIGGINRRNFCDSGRSRKLVFQREKIDSIRHNKERRHWNELGKESGLPSRVKSLENIDCGKDLPRAWHGFVKPFRDGLRKIKILILSRPTCAENGQDRGRLGDSPKRKVDGIE